MKNYPADRIKKVTPERYEKRHSKIQNKNFL